jgi:hypothetical protein
MAGGHTVTMGSKYQYCRKCNTLLHLPQQIRHCSPVCHQAWDQTQLCWHWHIIPVGLQSALPVASQSTGLHEVFSFEVRTGLSSSVPCSVILCRLHRLLAWEDEVGRMWRAGTDRISARRTSIRNPKACGGLFLWMVLEPYLFLKHLLLCSCPL